jgi:hypothetical protein
MMIGYDIYYRFTMEHFRLRQSMILTASFLCSRQFLLVVFFLFLVLFSLFNLLISVVLF